MQEETQDERLEKLKKRLDDKKKEFERSLEQLTTEPEKYGLFEEYKGGLSLRLSTNESSELRKLMI